MSRRLRVRSWLSIFAIIALMLVVPKPIEAGAADVAASCGPDGGELFFAEPTLFEFRFGYSNSSSSSVTFTATMLENDFFGPEQVFDTTSVPGGGIGTIRRITVSTEGFADGVDTITVRVTSSATGSEVLAECAFVLRIGDDADGDGLVDSWETAGIDTDGDGTPDVFFDPQHKDLLLELDYVAGQAPDREDIRAMKLAFAAAPVSNPDGTNGITLWVDTGDLVDPAVSEGTPEGTCMDGIDNGGDGLIDAADPECANEPGDRHYIETAVEDPGPSDCADGNDNDGDGLTDGDDPDCLVGDDLGGGNEVPRPVGCLDANFYTTKAAHFDNDPLMFRYGISGDPVDNSPCGGGRSEVGGNDFVEFNHDGGTVMHEFGHALNLRHGGAENDNCKPNYVSIMNYDNQFGIRRVGGGAILDYSPPRVALDGSTRGTAPLPDLIETELSESVVLDAGDDANRFVFVDDAGNKTAWPLDSDVDNDGTADGVNWNGDTDPPYETGTLSVNIDTSDATTGRPPACTNSTKRDSTDPLTGYYDWDVIAYNFRIFGDSADGAINPDPLPDPTLPELFELEAALNTADLSLTLADAPDPVAAGDELEYAISVTNLGPNPASSVQVVHTLPAGLSHVADTGGCIEATPGTLSCGVGELLPGAVITVAVTASVAPDLVYINGGPATVTASASVSNLVGIDPNPLNDAATTETDVRAVSDLEIASQQLVAPPTFTIIGESGELRLDKAVGTAGPSSPIDATVDLTASAAPGASITPSSAQVQLTALSVGALQSVTEQFTFACAEPGAHSFTIGNLVEPKNAEDADPDLANNAATTYHEVDCVVPVAINIKPGSFPNSLSLRERSVPVAVLSSTVGEYGLPLAFDATQIEPLSVRFGPRHVVLAGFGATEIHDRGHIQDAIEPLLPEETYDGDLDMVLHFSAAESGLDTNHVEACVAGEYFDDASGETFRFFGCDSTRVVPRPR